MSGKQNNTGLRMPVKTVDLDFADEGYPGFTCKRRLNARMGTLKTLREAESEEQSKAAILELFTEWNFVDEEGEPIPRTPEGIELLPQDLFEAMMKKSTAALREAALPANLDESSSLVAANHS